MVVIAVVVGIIDVEVALANAVVCVAGLEPARLVNMREKEGGATRLLLPALHAENAHKE
jgi:hypothetical protein